MRRTMMIVGAVVTVLVGSMAGVSPAGAGGGAAVTVVHGIGPAPSAVDVYIGETDATEWDSVDALDGIEYGESVDLGDLPAGGYNLLICTAAVVQVQTITSCADNGQQTVNGNSGSNVDLVAGVPEMWIAAYGEPGFGRPVVLEIEPDLACVEADANARVQAVHAATADPVNVLADGTEVIADLAHGESAALDVPSAAYDIEVELAADDSPVLAVNGFTPSPLVNTAVIVVGNPQFDADFDVVTATFDLAACPVVTTTTTTTAPPSVVATPRFTG
jgi:hypothetical protein